MPRFTSLHRPIGSFFLDLSICSLDDSLYDEAFGPQTSVCRCKDDRDYDDEEKFDDDFDEELNESLWSRQNACDRYDELDDRHGHYFEEPDDVGEWIVWRYTQYIRRDHPALVPDEPSVASMQHGCRRQMVTNAKGSVTYHFCGSKRNGGRKPQEWWAALARKRRNGLTKWRR